MAQVEACGDGLDNDCDGSTDEDETRLHEPNPACHEGDYRQYMTLCMLGGQPRQRGSISLSRTRSWRWRAEYVRTEGEDLALSRFVSIPVVETLTMSTMKRGADSGPSLHKEHDLGASAEPDRKSHPL